MKIIIIEVKDGVVDSIYTDKEHRLELIERKEDVQFEELETELEWWN